MPAQPSLLLVNGPNLNRLGSREPAIYGTETLSDIVARVNAVATAHEFLLQSFQSNHEGELIDFIQAHADEAVGLIINPGALSHYGYSLRDCLADVGITAVEVHISNVHRREPFRHQLVLAPVVTGQIVGLGTHGYTLAAEFLLKQYMSPSS